MSQTYAQQFKEVLACQTKEEAGKWLADEIARYGREFGQSAEEARNVILINLGYMAGYYDSATAHKVHDLFGATHPIFRGADYHERVTPEEACALGQK